jgi:hypothetical protein
MPNVSSFTRAVASLSPKYRDMLKAIDYGSTSVAGMITRLPSRAPRRWRQARDAVPRSGC